MQVASREEQMFEECQTKNDYISLFGEALSSISTLLSTLRLTECLSLGTTTTLFTVSHQSRVILPVLNDSPPKNSVSRNQITQQMERFFI